MLFSGDPRRPYPTDLEMRSGMLGHMANLPTNGVNGHLPGDALAAGRLPGESSFTVIDGWTLFTDDAGHVTHSSAGRSDSNAVCYAVSCLLDFLLSLSPLTRLL